MKFLIPALLFAVILTLAMVGTFFENFMGDLAVPERQDNSNPVTPTPTSTTPQEKPASYSPPGTFRGPTGPPSIIGPSAPPPDR